MSNLTHTHTHTCAHTRTHTHTHTRLCKHQDKHTLTSVSRYKWKIEGKKTKVFLLCVLSLHLVWPGLLDWAPAPRAWLPTLLLKSHLPSSNLALPFPHVSNLLRSCPGLLTHTLSPSLDHISLKLALVSFLGYDLLEVYSWALQIMMVPSTTSVEGPYPSASLQGSHLPGFASTNSPRQNRTIEVKFPSTHIGHDNRLLCLGDKIASGKHPLNTYSNPSYLRVSLGLTKSALSTYSARIYQVPAVCQAFYYTKGYKD